MFEVAVVLNFSAAHNLRGYRGKCEALHGHNWKVEAVLKSEKLDKAGMCEDFHVIKNKLKEILELFDHKYLNSLSYFKKTNPTSENIAKLIYEKMSDKMRRQGGIVVSCIKIWETPTSCAIYSQP